MGLLDKVKSFFVRGAPPPSPRRLDGRSRLLLAASMKMLPDGEPGWITMPEAKTLFSLAEGAYAFGETDEVGKRNLATFASETAGGCLFEFMPVEGRLYFMRKGCGAEE
jgi:hypothetical protein